MQPLSLGAFEIRRVVESEGPTSPRFLFPQARPGDFSPHLEWLNPRFYDPAADRLLMSIQSFVVCTPRHTLVVDTGLGNGKRRSNENWNLRNGPYLADLHAAGVDPAEVDFVLCTHLHVDHVGWNTRRVNGRWIPTFPNARYVFDRKEFRHGETRTDDERREIMADSVQPIVDAGQALFVEEEHTLCDGVRLEPTPGHTPGHYSVHLTSGGQEAVITGDLMHHPIQIGEPGWNSAFCADPDQACTTRHQFLSRYADRDVRILGTHFSEPCWGYVVTGDRGWTFRT